MAGWQNCTINTNPTMPSPASWLTHPADNPFSKRETHSRGSIVTYKILTLLSWLLSVVVSVYFTVHEPHDAFTVRRRIWDQNYLYPSAFTMNHILADIYWYASSSLP
jgi:hypothetical protein